MAIITTIQEVIMKKLKPFLLLHKKRVLAFALVLLFLICSVTVFAKIFTNPETYRETIRSIDDKKVSVLSVSAAIAGSATALATVPDDATTPLAEKMLDLCTYLIAVVCVLVLEKALLTVFGAAACYILFPIACILTLAFIVKKKEFLITWAIKIGVLALAFLIIIPSSMKLSDYIYEVNQISIEQKVDEIDSTQVDENAPWYQKLWGSITNAIGNAIESVRETAKEALNNFIDAVSTFVIAYCAIPIFVVFLFLWLIKFLFGLKIDTNPNTIKSKLLKNNQKESIPETTMQ